MQLSATPHAAIATLFPSPTLFDPKEWYPEHQEEGEAKFLHYFSTKTATRVAVQVHNTNEGKRYTIMEIR